MVIDILNSQIGILGSRGFLGSHILAVASNYGILVNRIEPSDVTVDKFCYDVIINCMMRMPASSRKFLQDENIRKSCYLLPRKLIEEKLKPGGLVINTSTYLQYFEGKAGNPIGVYAEYKQELSDYLIEKSQRGILSSVDLVFFTLYGPHDKDTRLVPALVNAYKEKKSMRMTQGTQFIHLLHVEDAAKAIINCLKIDKLENTQTFRCFEEPYLTIKEIVQIFDNLSGWSLDCLWGSVLESGVEMKTPWKFSIPVLPNLPSSITLENGLTKLLNSE
jgi:hypothetical protein